MVVHNRTRDQVLISDGEAATSFLARLRGLIGHAPLQEGQGMMIKPCSSIHTFGMGFPIDVVFADQVGRVVKTASEVPPNRIGPVARGAAFVLELPAGTIARTGIQVGDQIVIET